MLCKGPTPIVTELVRVASPYIRCSTVAGHTPVGGMRLLEFDDCYAVCRTTEIVCLNARRDERVHRSTRSGAIRLRPVGSHRLGEP
jgi:hypothetical protein